MRQIKDFLRSRARRVLAAIISDALSQLESDRLRVILEGAKQLKDVSCRDCSGSMKTGVTFVGYMVTDEVWREAGYRKADYACLDCLEKALARPLKLKDFPVVPVNNSIRWALKRFENAVGSETRDRLSLWAHVVSSHACMLNPMASMTEMVDYHEHEHDGPGTIRNHPREDRSYNLKKIGEVLSEAEESL